MSDTEIQENQDSNRDSKEEQIPQSRSSNDQSDREETHMNDSSNSDSQTYPNKSKEGVYLSTIYIHTTPIDEEKIIKVIDEFNSHDISIFTDITNNNNQHIDPKSSISSNDSKPDLPPIFTQHITVKFDDANDADACYLKIKDVILQSQYSIEIQYDTLSHPGNLYVRWIVPETTQEELKEIFERYGELTTCKIVYDDDNKSKSYGFVNYILKTSADNAIDELNNKEVGENRFYINHHISKKERLSKLEIERVLYTNLYVKNIPENILVDDLKELFKQYGPIESVFVPTIEDDEEVVDASEEQKEKEKDEDEEEEKDKHHPKLKGFGFVNYSNHDDAINAQKSLNNYEVMPGHRLLVTKAQKRDKGESSSNINDMQSFTRDFNRIRIYQPGPATTSAAAANYYTPNPNLVQAPQQAQYYYPPLGPPPTVSHQLPPQLYTPAMKNGLPIAGPNYQDSNLYIKNLPLDIGDDELTELFEPYGEIVSAKVITSDGEHSKGYGFVCFKSPQNASRALVEMANYPIDEYHVLHVSFAQRKDNRVGANGIVHHYNQNHFNYFGQNQHPRAGSIPLLSPQESTSSQQLQVLYNLLQIYPYYYYPPQGPNSPGYTQMPPPPSSYPPGTTMIPITPSPSQLLLLLSFQLQKSTPRQFQGSQPLQYLTLLLQLQQQLLNRAQLTQQQQQQQQHLQSKSPLMIPNYGVDYYGRFVSNGGARYPPPPPQSHQQQRYVMPPHQPPPPASQQQ